jgi:hypothetical protein
MRALLFLPLLLLICSCQQERPDLSGTWLGAYYELDQGEQQPFPLLMDFRPDSTYTMLPLYEAAPDSGQWFVHHNRFHIDTTVYQPEQWANTPDHFIFRTQPTFPFHYFRVVDTSLDLDSTAFQQILGGNTWQTESTWEYFSEDGTLQWRSHDQSDSYRYCWNIKQYNDLLFLAKKGNHRTCDQFHQFVEQIISVTDRQFQTRRWKDGQFQTITYQQANTSIDFPEADFQLCNKYLYINYPQHRYYYKGTVYKGGMYTIRKIFKAQFQPLEDVAEDGIIRIRFVVNCAGEAGLYEVLELDNDYREKQFDPRLPQRLLEITKTLQDWIPGKSPQTNQPIDTYKYLSFRIRDGQIFEIFP